MAGIVLLPGAVWAGDEVDYSAPYLTLEDGKLVTRYPANKHEQAPEAQTAGSGERLPADPPERRERPVWALAAAAALGLISIGAAVLRLRRRSSGQSSLPR